MDLSGPGVVYALMIIPLLFVVVVILQGIDKVAKKEPDGKIAIGFGIVFLVIIALAYFLYIK